MVFQNTSKTEPRMRLSRERVLRAGVALADQSGIESLSMRRLAQELRVEAMSLYHHVARKDDLLEGMLDLVYAEMELPRAEGEWRAAMRRCAISAHDVLLAHPWATRLLMSPAAPSAARLRWMDAVLRRLREAGFSAQMTHHAYHALDSFTVGFVLWVLPYLTIERERPDYAAQFLAQTSLDDLPHLAEHIAQHTDPTDNDVNEFEFGLDLLLDGLERLRVA